MKIFEITWGGFALIEFLLSHTGEHKTCLDVGVGEGIHSEILAHAGLDVVGIDKYSDKATYKEDFIPFAKKHKNKFDVIFCSHVIEHQRNVGMFLDAIYDLLNDNGILIITAPNHSALTLIEGHMSSMLFPLFLQHMIHAGFDCKNGKYLSFHENSFIVSKASNYNVKERLEDGYQWTKKHQERSPIPLTNTTFSEGYMLYNCKHILPKAGVRIPSIKYDMTIKMDRWNFQCTI